MLASRFPITCPVCREPDLLEAAGEGGLTCRRCGAEYPVVDGVPHLVPPAEGDEHKSRQVEFFDEEADPAFELSRPYGTPAFHAWLLREKFRHSISGIEELLPGATVLTVCGGSGMDGESLARAGADVAVSDISLRAAQRAEERGRRYGVGIAGIAADAEHLPFPDRSVDIVYVHDGLHHLARPEAGLAEMARVARARRVRDRARRRRPPRSSPCWRALRSRRRRPETASSGCPSSRSRASWRGTGSPPERQSATRCSTAMSRACRCDSCRGGASPARLGTASSWPTRSAAESATSWW